MAESFGGGAFELKEVPKRMPILGGSIIGLEMGTVYSALGARLDVVEMMAGIMQGADRDLVKIWQTMNDKCFDLQLLNNTSLMTEGLEINPDALDRQTLSERAWTLVEPQYRARQAAWGEAFLAARGQGLGGDDLNEVAKAAVEGRVAVLLLEEDFQIPGHLDGGSGRVEPANLQDPTVDDVLDDLGDWVERMAGVVHVVSPAQMPTSNGLAATFRH